MTPPAIRPARPEDHKPIIEVLDEWWGGRHMADMLPRLFFVHFRPTSFVAEDQGRPVGFIVGFVSQTDPAQAYIHFVGVRPGHRQGGLGRALYETFFAAAKALGCREVLSVTSPVNKGSIAFHRRMGFAMEESGTAVDGVPVFADYDGKGEDRVLFSKVI